MSNITFTTSLFDLGSLENNNQRRSNNEYLEYGKYVLSLDINLVIFIEPKNYNFVWEQRNNNNLLSKTHIVTIELSDLPYYSLLNDVTKCLDQNPLINGHSFKDTPYYFIVMWSKYSCIQYTIKHNPFHSSHVGWIDFGISHVGSTSTNFVHKDKIFELIYDKIRIMFLNVVDYNYIIDLKEYCKYKQSITACGFFTGNMKNIKKICNLLDHKIKLLINMGIVLLDEEIMTIIYLEYPEIFDLYYGNYCDIFNNYKHLRTGYDIIINILNTCSNLKLYKWGYKIGSMLFQSYTTKIFPMDYGQLCNFLNIYYIITYYMSQDKSISAEIVKYFLDLTTKEPLFNEEFNKQKKYLENNFYFVKDYINNWDMYFNT